jgi:hypothetical protein
VRARIAVAAWLRFDLMGQQKEAQEEALATSKLVEQIAPELAGIAQQYRNLPGAPERHYALVVSALKYGLSPVLQSYAHQLKRRTDDAGRHVVQAARKPGAAYYENIDAEFSLPMPNVGNTAARDKELAQLGTLKTATGYFGDTIMPARR